MRKSIATVYRERAILIGVLNHNKRPQFRGQNLSSHDTLEELANLSETAGAVVVDKIYHRLDTPTPKYYIGSGKVKEVAELVRSDGIDVVIFDNDLSPAQVRNLEMAINTKVIDRTELILYIFAVHAKTNEAKLQVELAQLEYTLPRLKRMWTHLSRQEGSLGIAQRGPGEKQIEIDRRLANDRIAELKRELSKISSRRHREVTSRSDNYNVSLVGYTNAGKSTLMHALTGADVYIDDKLFSTLDTKTRVWNLKNGQKLLLSDTVGFIKNLPHTLVSSFHATLAEASEADLLLHVVDASNPNHPEQVDAVNSVLREIECGDKRHLLILNKIDALTDNVEGDILTKQYPDAIQVSALKRIGIDELERRITEILAEQMVELQLKLPLTEGKVLAELSQTGQIIEKRFTKKTALLTVRLPKREEYRFELYKSNHRGKMSTV